MGLQVKMTRGYFVFLIVGLFGCNVYLFRELVMLKNDEFFFRFGVRVAGGHGITSGFRLEGTYCSPEGSYKETLNFFPDGLGSACRFVDGVIEREQIRYAIIDKRIVILNHEDRKIEAEIVEWEESGKIKFMATNDGFHLSSCNNVGKCERNQ